MSNIKWTKDQLLTEALKYNTRKELQKANQALYSAIAYRDLKDEAFAHMPKHAPRKWTTKALKEEIAKYTSKKEFREANRNAYDAVAKQKLIPELLGHFDDEKLRLENQLIPVPNKLQGIYILYKDNDIVYVGKSERCVMNRIRKHVSTTSVEYKSAITGIDVYIIPNTANMDVAEIYLINKYKPVLNKESNSDAVLTLDIPNIDSIIDTTYTLKNKDNTWILTHNL